MFGPNHYVPVLKCKRGERQALEALPNATKDNFTPVIEVDEIPEDLDTGEPKTTLDVHCTRSIDPLVDAWGTTRKFFLDAGAVDAYQSSAGAPGVRHTFDHAANLQLQFIPTVGLARPAPEIAAAMQHKSRGICLRLVDDDFASGNLQAVIDAFLSSNKLEKDSVDVIVDLGVVTGDGVARVAALAGMYVGGLPYVTAWRTLSLTASAFPESMGAVARQSTTTIERIEWLAWQQLYAQRSTLARLPTYGDYGIQHPIMLEGFDPRYMAVSANIRYTLDNEWLIMKGQSTRIQGGKVQFQTLSKQLVNRQEYMGPKHCVGCEDIDACANGASRMGSASAWRRIGAVHHISHAAAQIGGLTWP